MNPREFKYGKRDIGLLQDLRPYVKTSIFQKIKKRLKKEVNEIE